MATYKVIQDVEAEDKLLGPLTLRQFIYAGISAVLLYLCYFLATHGAMFMIVFFLPVALVTAFFAFPWGRDQPTEIWALAKIRFLIKPRRRIWDQSGAKELVTITAPKQVATNYTNGLSQTEVTSRLHALADTIDSRGWAIKNSNLNLYTKTPLVMADPTSDRLVAPASLPQPVDSTDIQAADDILDEKNNANAQRLDTMINQSAKAHRDRIVESLQQNDTAAPPRPNDYWFLHQPAPAASIPSNMVTFNTQVVTPGMPVSDTTENSPGLPKSDEANLVAELESRKQQMPDASFYGHLHHIEPLSQQGNGQRAAPAPLPAIQPMPVPNAPVPPSATQSPTQTPPPVTPQTQAAILTLASNDDLNVATIAREAERTASQDEVVIKLH